MDIYWGADKLSLYFIEFQIEQDDILHLKPKADAIIGNIFVGS
jgi:hypothetical protein